MHSAPDSYIVGRQLNDAEREKLERLTDRLLQTFQSAGFTDVCYCEANGAGEERRITFLRGESRAPLISFTALAFLAVSGQELTQMIQSHLGGTQSSGNGVPQP